MKNNKLKKYEDKRDFNKTTEPSPSNTLSSTISNTTSNTNSNTISNTLSNTISNTISNTTSNTNSNEASNIKSYKYNNQKKHPIFVIQKHDATRLHYDFRLEIDGVLKSWAVPKGPSTDPKDKRLAVETEDHPMSYAQFEGVIPENNYGAGPVLIWDSGTYTNNNIKDNKLISLEDSYKNGHIVVELNGYKLKGGYALIRTNLGKNNKNWLLIKTDDNYAHIPHNPVKNEPQSVKSHRTIEEIREEKK